MLSVVLLITLGSYVTCIERTRSLPRKQTFARKKRNLWRYLTPFMLMSLLARILHLLVPKMWYPKEYWTDILVTVKLRFLVQTGKEISHKICVDKIVDNLLQQPVLRSKWNLLVEECGYKISKGRSNIFLDQALSLFIKICSFSYAKDIV